MDNTAFFSIFFGWLFFSAVAVVIARRKGRSGFLYFLVSFLASPLIGIIAALVVSPDTEKLEERELGSGRSKKCPLCAEIIKAEAQRCRFCGGDLTAPNRQSPTPEAIYITRGEQQLGPYSSAQIAEMIASSQLYPMDLAWHEGLSEWTPLFKIGHFTPQPEPTKPSNPISSAPRRKKRIPTDRQKPRGAVWVVSTHILTASTVMPFVFSVIGIIIAALTGQFRVGTEQDGITVLGLLVILGCQIVGYHFGLNSSFRYIRQRAFLERPTAYIVPSIVVFVVLTLLWYPFQAKQAALTPAGYAVIIIYDIIITLIFSFRTRSGFLALEQET